jgi:lysophospholipase L1-like esterase
MTTRTPAAAAPVVCLALFAGGCGGSGGGPSGPGPVTGGATVGVAVYYDENANGVLDASEAARIPEAVIEIAGHQGRSAAVTGESLIQDVPAGVQTVTVRPSSLPPLFEPPRPMPVTVPQTAGTTFLPVTLPIGSNRPNVYLAFGDSITAGEGSIDERGYVSKLERRLQGYFGRATLINDGLSATRSNRGLDRLPDSLTVRPAYTLIHYGTNDWNVGECKFNPPCFTIESLQRMVQAVKARQGIPVLSTLIPTNPRYADSNPGRNSWVAGMDVRIRDLARAEGALLADPEPLFLAAPDLTQLYVDHIHPNDAGYELMAQAFFTAITRQAP